MSVRASKLLLKMMALLIYNNHNDNEQLEHPALTFVYFAELELLKVIW